MTSPSIRCFPREDTEFERDVTAEMAANRYVVELTIKALRLRYPGIRIAERASLAMIGEEWVWYCYRDGRAVPGDDGVGAMRTWTRIEALTNHSIDLLEWSSELLARSRQSLREASEAGRTDART
jgi:hypothetical protein